MHICKFSVINICANRWVNQMYAINMVERMVELLDQRICRYICHELMCISRTYLYATNLSIQVVEEMMEPLTKATAIFLYITNASICHELIHMLTTFQFRWWRRWWSFSTKATAMCMSRTHIYVTNSFICHELICMSHELICMYHELINSGGRGDDGASRQKQRQFVFSHDQPQVPEIGTGFSRICLYSLCLYCLWYTIYKVSIYPYILCVYIVYDTANTLQHAATHCNTLQHVTLS